MLNQGKKELMGWRGARRRSVRIGTLRASAAFVLSLAVAGSVWIGGGLDGQTSQPAAGAGQPLKRGDSSASHPSAVTVFRRMRAEARRAGSAHAHQYYFQSHGLRVRAHRITGWSRWISDSDFAVRL